MLSVRSRRLITTLAFAGMVVGTLFGFGLIGDRVENLAGGALSASATLLAPATRAFSIWSVIYLGLLAYLVWVWTPGHAASPRAGRIEGKAAASMLLNAAWLIVTQFGWLWVSVAVIAALAAVLGLLVKDLVRTRPASPAEAVIVDGTFGLYLGWVSVATAANITATLVASGARPAAPIADTIAIVVLAVVAALAAVLARQLRATIGVGAAMTWGLAWIAAGRLTGPLVSVPVGVAAAVVAVFVGLLFAVPHLRRVPRPVTA